MSFKVDPLCEHVRGWLVDNYEWLRSTGAIWQPLERQWQRSVAHNARILRQPAGIGIALVGRRDWVELPGMCGFCHLHREVAELLDGST
jgi:hypothetical protein